MVIGPILVWDVVGILYMIILLQSIILMLPMLRGLDEDMIFWMTKKPSFFVFVTKNVNSERTHIIEVRQR